VADPSVTLQARGLRFIVCGMATEALTTSFGVSADLAGALTKRLARYFKVHVEDWYDVCRRSVVLEDRLFADELSPDVLAEHARLLDELERTGKFFQQAMQTSGFADQTMMDLVSTTLQDIKDRRALWQGKLNPQQRGEILRAVFNES
jgi:hypothetical protein